MRLAAPKKLTPKNGRLHAAGYVEIEIDGDRFKLPLPSSVDCAEGEFRDGTRVSLIGVFSSTSRAHRDAAIPWPNNAFLVASEASSARESWLWRATGSARLSAMAAVVAFVMVYVAYIAHIAG